MAGDYAYDHLGTVHEFQDVADTNEASNNTNQVLPPYRSQVTRRPLPTYSLEEKSGFVSVNSFDSFASSTSSGSSFKKLKSLGDRIRRKPLPRYLRGSIRVHPAAEIEPNRIGKGVWKDQLLNDRSLRGMAALMTLFAIGMIVLIALYAEHFRDRVNMNTTSVGGDTRSCDEVAYINTAMLLLINQRMENSLPEQAAVQAVEQHEDEIAKRVLRKIDWRLIPLMFITYNLNFMDKTILSSASVFGLREDTHLQGQQYSWVSSVFYFGYFFWEYPTTFLITRLPVAKYLAANTFVWGAVVALTAACSNYGGLITVRFLLGVAEATITPAFLFITSTWYTRDEIPTRTGLWFAGNSVGGLLASFLAYGLGHIEDSLAPWVWMYIILGCMTFLWGIPMLLFLPDSIATAKFLTEDERDLATRRVILSGTGRTDNSRWKLDQALECLRDPKTWIIFSMSLLTQIPNGGTQNFGNLVLKSFGFTSLQSTLLVIPASVIAAGTIAVTGWIAGRFRQMNCILVICVVMPAVFGSTLIYVRPRTSSGVQLFGYFLLSTGPGAIPLLMSLVGANYKGVTKKMTMTALLFIAYCAGNIAGPQFFRANEAPHYNTAFKAILVCYCLVVGLAVVLRCYLQWLNLKREREEGVKGSAGSAGVIASKVAEGANQSIRVAVVDIYAEDFDDVTDWKTFGFRYRL